MVDNQDEYHVERLIRKRRIRRGRGWSTQYLIRWRDYGLEHDIWQPEWTVVDTLVLNEYERFHGVDAAIRTPAVITPSAVIIPPAVKRGRGRPRKQAAGSN